MPTTEIRGGGKKWKLDASVIVDTAIILRRISEPAACLKDELVLIAGGGNNVSLVSYSVSGFPSLLRS